MQFKQRKIIVSLALAISVLFITTEIASACSENTALPPYNAFYDNVFFSGSIALVFAIIVFYFLKRYEGILIPAIAVVSLLLFMVLSPLNAPCCACWIATELVKAEFFFLMFLFACQFFSWIYKSRILKIKLK